VRTYAEKPLRSNYDYSKQPQRDHRRYPRYRRSNWSFGCPRGEDYDKRHVHVATSYRNTSYGNTSSYRNISYANTGSYRSTSCGNTSSYSSCRFDRPTYHNNDN